MALFLLSLAGGFFGACLFSAVKWGSVALAHAVGRSAWYLDWLDRRLVYTLNGRPVSVTVQLFRHGERLRRWVFSFFVAVFVVTFFGLMTGCTLEPEPRFTGSDAWFSQASRGCTIAATRLQLLERGCI